MQTSFKISASDSTSVFDAVRKFSPIKYQRSVGQEQNIEPFTADRIYKIGDFAEGGVVIWVTDDKKHGLVVSRDNLGPTTGYTLSWGPTGTTTGATANNALPKFYTKPIPNENYSGYKNQQVIEGIINWGVLYPAFKAAADYSITVNSKTYSDWFLPTLTELQQIYENRDVVTKVSVNKGGDALFTQTTDPGKSVYWSSREDEDDSDLAWGLGFFFGDQFTPLKDFPYAVRCVRAF